MLRVLAALPLFCLFAVRASSQATNTPNLQLQIPAFNQTNWQVPINYDMNALDGIIAGTQTLPVGATPLISQQANWITQNTVSTTITNLVGGLPGQTVRIFCGDGLTLITGSANISVGSSPWSCSSSLSITLVLLNSKWIEVARSGGAGGGGSTPCIFIPLSLQYNNSGTLGCVAGSAIGPDGSLDKLIINNSATGGAQLQVGTGVGGGGGVVEVCYTTTSCPAIAGAPLGIVLQEGILNGQLNWVDSSSGYDILGVDTANNLNWNNGKFRWSKIGFEDNVLQSNPGNPASGYNRLYMDSTSGLLTCLTSSGTNCLSGTAGTPLSSLQYNNAGAFGGTNLKYAPLTALCNSPVPCDQITDTNELDFLMFSTGTGDNLFEFVYGPPVNGGTILFVESQSSISGSDSNAAQFVGAVDPTAGTTGVAYGMSVFGTDEEAITATANRLTGLKARTVLNRASGHTVTISPIWIYSPTNSSGGNPSETVTNEYGIDIADQLGLSTTDYAPIKIRPQTTPGSGTKFSIEADTGSGVASFNDGVRAGGVIVSALPSAASNPGLMMYVTDSTTISAEGQTCVGSSSNKALAFSNGVSWKCF
jgi:hypothetical protein